MINHIEKYSHMQMILIIYVKFKLCASLLFLSRSFDKNTFLNLATRSNKNDLKTKICPYVFLMQ
jgi:hypothetical protein